MMRKKKIFTPMIAVGLAMSLSVGSEIDKRDYIPDLLINPNNIGGLEIHQIPNAYNGPSIFYKNNAPLDSFRIVFDDSQPPSTSLTFETQNPQNAILNLGNEDFIGFENTNGAWINNFSIDLTTRNSNTAMELFFYGRNGYAGFSGVENDGITPKKTSFQILDNQADDGLIRSYFNGSVFSDFIINAGGTYVFSFQQEVDNPNNNNVTGNITLRGIDNHSSFDFGDVTYQGTFTNAISTDTQINLNNSNTQFIGDINTTGGTTTINFLTSGATFQGNINANGGNNIINFSSGNFIFSVPAISSTNNSTNTLNINGDIRLIDNQNYTNYLTLKGAGKTDGDNIINIADGGYLDAWLQLDSGLTKINFLGSTGGIQDLRSYSDTNWQNAGSSIVTFAKNGTFHIPGASVPYNSGKTHTFVIDKTIVFDDNFTAGGMGMNGPGEDGGVIFQIENSGSLSFQYNGTLATLNSYEHDTQIKFIGNTGDFSAILGSNSASNAIITFDQDGAFGFGGTIFAIGTYNKNDSWHYGLNRFIVNHNIIFNTQLSADASYDACKGNVFLVSDQKTLSFSNADDTAYLKTIGGNTQIIFEGSSGGFGGNLIAEGGNNEFTFENTGAFSFTTANLIANNSSQNVFTIDKNITINSDMTLSGNASSSGGNIFNISSGKTLSFKNGSTLTTLTTNSGFSHLLFSGSGAFEGNINTTGGNSQLSFNGSGGSLSGDITTSNGLTEVTYASSGVLNGNINTTGGNSQLSFNGSSGTLNGNIQTDGGKTLLSLSSNTTSLTLNSTFTANSSGINQINFSNTSPLTITSENGLVLNGNTTYESGGGNILVGKSYSFSLQNLQGTKQAITTQSGVTKIDGISFEGNIQTLGGITFFGNLPNTSRGIFIKGNIIANNGDNVVVNSSVGMGESQWLAYGNSKNIFYSSGYTTITSGNYYDRLFNGITNPTCIYEISILGGDNNNGGNIFYIEDNATIHVGSDPTGSAIMTNGGLTQIIFAGKSGSFEGSVIANGGNNEIVFKQSGSFHLEEVFWAKGTSANTIQIQKNVSISTKILKTDNINGGNIINISDGANLTITDSTIYTDSGSYSGRFLVSTGGGKNVVHFKGASGGFSGNIIASGADNDIIFSQSGTFDISGGDIPNYYNDAIFLAFSSNNNFLVGNHSVIISTAFSTYSEHGSGNNFIIDSGGSLTFSESASLYADYSDGSTNFIIGDGGSLNSINGREKTSLVLTGSGKTSIEFDNYGSLSGNIQTQYGVNTLYFKNRNKGISPYATLDTNFEALYGGENIISIDANGAILKSNNGLQFSSSQNGKNRVKLLGDGVSLTLQNISDNQIQTINSNGVSEVHFVGANQTFNGNILSLSGTSTITLGGVDNSSNAIVGKATINGNITAGGGNNTFNFLHDSSTLSMGASSQAIANSTSTNTFTIDKNITFLTDLTLSGNATGNGGNIFNISSGKNLVLQDSSSAIKTLYTTGGQSKVTFEGSGNLVANLSTSGGQTYVAFGGESTSVSNTKDIQATQNGANTLTFSGGAKTGAISSSGEGSNTLTINGVATLGDINSSGGSNEITLNGGGTLGNVVANGGSNIINLGANISTLSLTLGKSINATQGSNTINVLSQNLTLSGTITSSSGQNHINLNTSGGILDFSEATFSTSSDKNNHIHLKDSGTFIITAKSTSTSHIAFDLDSEGAELKFGGDLSTIGTAINFNANNTTLISNITTTAGTTTLTLNTPKSRDTWKEMSAYIEGKITTAKGAETNLVFSSSNQRLILKDDAQITNITHQANNGISFYHTSRSSTDFKTLTIGSKNSTTSGISGNGLNFIVYAISNTPEASLETQPSARGVQNNTPTKAYADKIVIHSSSNEGASTHNLGVVFENQDNINLDAISYTKGADNNILIASVSDSSKVSFNTQSTQVLGFDVAKIDYVKESTDENGNISGSGYTSYFVGKAKATEVVEAEQEITATAFTLNYDLYMANLNSLNKRMGELRENAHSQGVWARIFNGALTNSFGLESKSNYTTIQTGYDYAFGFEGANNYLGVALSYALSTSTSQNAFDENGQRRGIDGIYSNAVEVALYNSYVSDRGWYNDSIAKFSYIMSKFDINNLNDNTSTSNDTSNFAFTLGDEVGYVFKLGEAKEWSITPQVEFTMGYFNQSDFKQTLSNSSAYLDSIAESVFTLRTRVGSAFAYDFKNFTQKDTFNASLYIGAFYEYDYVSGGEIKMSTQRETQTNKYSNLSSNGRVVMNVGTNMSIQDHARLYFDFEKSFAGKITTDYQVNFGVRYSFGESSGYTPMIEKAEFEAPLKVEEESKEEQESKKAQESKEAEKIRDKPQEETKNTQEKKAQ